MIFIVKEYNDWMDKVITRQVSPTDTSMAMKGVLDANKYFNKKRNFYLNFFANGLLTPLVGLPTALISGFTKPVFLRVPDEKLKNNTDYMSGYKMRAFQMKNRSAGIGNLCGYALLVATIVVINVIGK